ncbi:MAG: response regulator transcription factor [Proteobacteria bacterium]|nr:response regulator transcription factor [Pseudomonadota bacterium]
MCVDDHPIFRQGLAAVLASDPSLELVAEAETGELGVARFREFLPDVTLMDLRLPGLSGIETIVAIRQMDANARVVVLTTETGDALIERALAAGARGYALKGMAWVDLLAIIHAVHAGRIAIPGLVATQITEHLGDKSLSTREIEVLRLIANGHRNKSVAKELSISEDTVKMHVKNTMAKLNANDRTHAVTIAIQRGFISV